MSDQPKEPQSDLLGDLESIRELFDADAAAETEAAQAVPLLDDVVEIPEAEPDSAEHPAPPAAFGTQMQDDLFQALLGDEWRDSAAEVFQQARAKIEENSPQWAPEDTDELNDALKVRIDETMQGWMRGMVIEHMANLHETLLDVLAAELPQMIDNIVTSARTKDTDGQ